MIFSTTLYPYLSVNPLFSFAACSYSALKISQIFIKQAYLRNLSREQVSKTKKIIFFTIQLTAVITSVTYPTGSIIVLMALHITVFAFSRFFQKPFVPSQLPAEDISHVKENQNPFLRFKMLEGDAKCHPMLHFAIQTEKAKILNNHPTICTLACFGSFEEMIQFAKTYKVHKLNLSKTRLSDNQIEILTHHLPHLSHLNISDSHLDDLKLERLTSHLSKLTYLNLNYCQSITSIGFQTLTSLTSLTRLETEGCQGFENSNLQAIATSLSKLHHLNISWCCKLDSTGIQALLFLKDLSHLNISGSEGVDDSSLNAISPHLINLTYLNISDCKNVGNLGIQALISFKHLAHLIMSDCDGIDDASLKVITTHLTNLTELNIELCRNIGLSGIKNLVSLKNLTHLILPACCHDASLYILAFHLVKLTYLDISFCHRITALGIQALTPLKNLTQLNLSGCSKIDDSTLEMIASQLVKLTHLNLSYCKNVTPKGIQALASLKNLNQLNLSHCKRIDDVSLRMMISHLTSLTELNMSECSKLTASGIQALASLKNLLHLDLSYCDGIDDMSLQTVTSHLKRLVILNLDGCTNISTEGIKSIATSCLYLFQLTIEDCPQIDIARVQSFFPKTQIDA